MLTNIHQKLFYTSFAFFSMQQTSTNVFQTFPCHATQEKVATLITFYSTNGLNKSVIVLCILKSFHEKLEKLFDT